MPQPVSRHPNFPVPYGTQRRAKGWRQEGILRLLENVLSVGEDPENLVIYAALGKAARNWASHDKIVETLKTMDEDQTLVIQSGKPIGLFKTHEKAPLVIMANCNLVGQWARAEVFYDLQQKGLIYAATPASDFICSTLQLAAGMNMHVFTTGRGTPYGLAAVPVVKVATRDDLARRWHDLMDINAGRIATGEATIADVGWELFHFLLDVASGRKKTWAEQWKLHNALTLFNPAPVT